MTAMLATTANSDLLTLLLIKITHLPVLPITTVMQAKTTPMCVPTRNTQVERA